MSLASPFDVAGSAAVLPAGDIAAMVWALLANNRRSPPQPPLLALIAALQGETQALRFAISELSLSCRPQRPPAIRLVAEVADPVSLSPPVLSAARSIAHGLFALLPAPQPVAAFDDAFSAVYAGASALADDAFRFGLAVEWAPGRPAAVKAYFDLFAGGRATSTRRLKQVFAQIGLSAHWSPHEALARQCDLPPCRGIGMDFDPALPRNAKLYYSGRSLTISRLAALLSDLSFAGAGEKLDLFARHILNGARTAPLQGTLFCPVYVQGTPPRPAILKLDAFLPHYKPDDRAAQESIIALAEGLGLALPAEMPLRGSAETQAHMQYCSLDLDRRGEPKLGVYMRLTDHAPYLTRRQRPRRKEPALARLDRAVRAAQGYLASQRAVGYSEATHRMRFPHAAGFGGSSEWHEGKTFSMALILDALQQLELAGFAVDRPAIDADVAVLLGLRSPAGAWAYFPLLPELPPDADDLAQVLRVLAWARPAETAAAAPAIAWLAQQQAPDGSFPTWIINPADHSPAAERMRWAAANLWGTTPDPEVMANLADVLTVLNPAATNDFRARALAYIVAAQQTDGAWPASWYWGPYYGVFACCRFIGHAWPGHPSLQRAHAFLNRAYSAAAAFGSPTDTALALETLALLRSSVPSNTAILSAAVNWLLDRQHDDGTWEESPLIRMATGRARGRPGAVLSFASRTLSTAFAMRALAAARDVIAG